MKLKIKVTEALVKRVVKWLLLVGIVWLFTTVVVQSYDASHKLSNSTIPEDIVPMGEYKKYLDQFPNAAYPANIDIVLLGTEAFDSTFATVDYTAEHGMQALKTTSSGYVTWKVTIAQAGFYNIFVDYIPEPDRGTDIERRILLNGEVPYDDLDNIAFQRVWGDGGEKIVDITGNEIKPRQVEIPTRRTTYVQDNVGYVTQPYLIYFPAGVNELTIESVRESMSIFSVHVRSRETYPTYAEVYENYVAQGYQKVSGAITGYYEDPELDWIEGEDAILRSSPTIYAISDRSSGATSPSDPVRIILNAIGGQKWANPGDWITWEFTVPETGLYNITLRARQSVSRGLFSTRKVYINGEIPFAEAQNTKFVYDSKWSMVTLGTEDEAFYFYLEEGTHTITLESTLGDYGTQINRVQQLIDDLNSMYRQIISTTGISPDKYTDYRLTEKIPTLIETFERSADELNSIAEAITEISGEKSSETASLETMALQLRNFVRRPRTIQQNLGSFSTNISSLGTWILTVSRQTLTIDYLMVHSDDYRLPKANPNFFVGSWFAIRGFVRSFFFDYSSIGTTELNEDATTIQVWLLTSPTAGREQANSIRTLIDDTFDKTLNVELKVVDPSVLLTATLAGIGPDIAINVDNGTPVNYALRGAMYDISQFDDFEEVRTRFKPSAMTPYHFEGGYYALPDTQSFLMLFYRKDIFADQGWAVPNTWTDVINLIPNLQLQNLQFFLPLNTVGASSVVNPVFASRLYQTGGTFYREELNENNEKYLVSNFDSEEAMAAFEFWCEFYTDYGFSMQITDASFINRFRSGEMPIGIAAYNTYNTLAVSAPEIRGKWTFALLPGTPQDDGSLDRHGAAFGSAITMMRQTKIPNEAWEFMKWWTSTETQVGYAREIEAILGTAARHPTANVEAFKQLPWTVAEQSILLEQWEVTVGVPEVAGGYYTGRNLENAFRYVVNNNANPRNTLEDYILTINSEIFRKREEFGLPVPGTR